MSSVQDGSPSHNFKALALMQALGFFLVFAAFNAAQNLAGNLPGPPGLNTVCFAVLYGTYTLLCIPAPKVVDRIGPKMAMVVGVIPYVLLVFAFLLPQYCTKDTPAGQTCMSESAMVATKVVIAALVGVGAPLVWTGQGIYLARAASWSALKGVTTSYGVSSVESGKVDPYSAATTGAPLLGSIGLKERIGEANKKFNGIFFTVFQASGAAGLIVASLILTFAGPKNGLNVLFITLGCCCFVGLMTLTFCLPALDAVPSDDEDNSGEKKPETTIFSTLSLCFTDARMYLMVPNILYNGMSLGFIWNSYNTEVWGPVLGTSFVGFGSAAFYLTNSIFTQLTAKLALKIGQIGVMVLATACHVIFFVGIMILPVTTGQCEPMGCGNGVSGDKLACFQGNSTSDGKFHADTCLGGGNHSKGNCAVCAPFNADGQCGTGFSQCEWLQGDMVAPSGMMVFVIFLGAAVFALGDSVWEGQVPAVLQTLHDSKSGRQEPAMANLKMWQSLGVAIQFTINIYLGTDIATEAVVLLVCLGVSSLCLLATHYKVANLDTGKLRSEVGMYDDLGR
jgi:MFS family permease